MASRRSTLHVQRALAGVAIALTLALGWLAHRFDRPIDLTANARHTLTDGTRAALLALDTPVELVAVLPDDRATRDAVRELVDRYRTIKPDLSLAFLDPDTDPAAARALNAAPGGELIIRGAGREQRLQRLDERALTGALRQLGREGTRTLAFVTGHGERDPVRGTNDDWSEIAMRLAAIGLESRAFSFATEPDVPADVDVLVLAAPRSPYLPGEINGLMRYVRGGGNLLWLIETPTAEALSPAADADADADVDTDSDTGDNASAPPLAAAIDASSADVTTVGPGLEALATELGIATLPGRIIDTASQSLVEDAPDFVVLSAHPDHPVTRGLTAPLLLPQARALAITPLAGQDTRALLATPESSWTETGELEGEVRFDAAAGETAGPLLLGATIERPQAAPGSDAAPQRIALIGDADLGASRFIGNGANAAFVESLLVWLVGDDEALAFVTPTAPDAALELDARTIVILSVVCLLVMPLALLGIALAVRLRMRRG